MQDEEAKSSDQGQGKPDHGNPGNEQRPHSKNRNRKGKKKLPAKGSVSLPRYEKADSERRLELSELLRLVSASASTRVGKDRITELQPETSPSIVRSRLAEVGELTTRLKDGLQLGLSGLGDLSKILGRDGSSGGQLLDGPQLSIVARVLDRARSLRRVLEEDEYPHLKQRALKLTDLPALRERLENTLSSHGEIMDSASSKIFDLRKEARALEKEIKEWLESQRDKSPWKKFLQSSVITPRNGRFCWSVRAECRHQIRGVVHAESASGQTLFLEPEQVVRTGNKLQRVQERIQQEQRRILGELSREVWLKHEKVMELWNHLVELDVIQAKSKFAQSLGCEIPEIVEERDLLLIQARHPLLIWRELEIHGHDDRGLEKAYETITHLDLQLKPNRYQLVVTGPNTGGKTVVLKTVGLLSMMVACGLPVPVSPGSRIPVFDQIFADIGDEQSLQQDLSTFSAHVTIVASILQSSTSRSLVLLDELGSGTDPLEGAPLAEAVLDGLYEKGTMALVTTHLGRLKEYAYRRRKCENAAMEFDPEKLAPTYKLKVGLPGRSNALVIAERIGMPADVVSVARERSEKETGIDPEVIEGLRRSQSDLERRVREAQQHGDKAKQLARDVEQQSIDQRNTRGALEYEMERSEEQRVHSVIDQVESALNRIGELTGERGVVLSELRSLLEDSRSGTRLNQRRLESARSLRKGDSVFVPRLQQVCEVKKINKEKQKLGVLLNGIATEVQFSEISWVLPPPGFQVWWDCDELTSNQDEDR